MYRWQYDEPNMSDNSLLVKVEDLIYMSLGPDNINVVNFKIIQLILHILARQLRMLEQQVEIRVKSIIPEKQKTDKGSLEALESVSESPTSLAEDKKKRSPEREKKAKGKEKDERKSKKGKVHEASKDGEDEEKHKHHKEKRRASSKKYDEDTGHVKKDKRIGLNEKDLSDEDIADTYDDSSPERQQGKKGKEKRASPKKETRHRGDEEKDGHEIGKKQDKKKQKRDADVASEQSINIEEEERNKTKVLVEAEASCASAFRSLTKDPLQQGVFYVPGPRPRVGSVEVVTQSQFELLDGAVKQLMKITGPLAPLEFPDNEQLRSELLKGNASLTEAMETMQVNARVKAAEQAIVRMTGLLTQLAAAGALPQDLADQVEDVKLELLATAADEATMRRVRSRPSSGRKSVGIEARARSPGPGPARPSFSGPLSRSSQLSQRSFSDAGLTRTELDEMVRSIKADMTRNIQQLTSKSSAATEVAARTVNIVSEKLEVALRLDDRMNELQVLMSDYGVQLSGFDAGLTTQMQGFQEQMTQIRAELKCGLQQFASVNDNTEATAIRDLTERYEDLKVELEEMNTTNQALYSCQFKLGDELRSLVESVEMLRDQKADRDEVLDALRDKADISHLSGLLSEADFAKTRAQLEGMFDLCYEKFHKQDRVWMNALGDVMKTVETKAGQLDLISARDEVQSRLQEMHRQLQCLEEKLGEPKAALLMRQLASGALCGACGGAALMEPGEPPRPPALPAAAAPPALHSADQPHGPSAPPAPLQPCRAPITRAMFDEEAHACLRWCGGSHTLLAAGRQRARPHAARTHAHAHTRRYDGLGTDGKLYLLEEDLLPCVECNLPSPESQFKSAEFSEVTAVDGAGDGARNQD